MGTPKQSAERPIVFIGETGLPSHFHSAEQVARFLRARFSSPVLPSTKCHAPPGGISARRIVGTLRKICGESLTSPRLARHDDNMAAAELCYAVQMISEAGDRLESVVRYLVDLFEALTMATTTEVVIQALTAFGTVAVAAVALWGEKARAWLSPPKVIIEPHNLEGDPTVLTGGQVVLIPSPGIRVMYYHLKVVNKRPWLTVHNCRVLLKHMSRRGPDGKFYAVRMPVPPQFVWALMGPKASDELTITNERVFDLGRVQENGNGFEPSLYVYPNNFSGFVRKGEAVRYGLEINASNFVSQKVQVFEVAWDGQWSFEREQMQRHLTIREIAEA